MWDVDDVGYGWCWDVDDVGWQAPKYDFIWFIYIFIVHFPSQKHFWDLHLHYGGAGVGGWVGVGGGGVEVFFSNWNFFGGEFLKFFFPTKLFFSKMFLGFWNGGDFGVFGAPHAPTRGSRGVGKRYTSSYDHDMWPVKILERSGLAVKSYHPETLAAEEEKKRKKNSDKTIRHSRREAGNA